MWKDTMRVSSRQVFCRERAELRVERLRRRGERPPRAGDEKEKSKVKSPTRNTRREGHPRTGIWRDNRSPFWGLKGNSRQIAEWIRGHRAPSATASQCAAPTPAW